MAASPNPLQGSLFASDENPIHIEIDKNKSSQNLNESFSIDSL